MLKSEDFTSLLEYNDVSLRDYQKENKSKYMSYGRRNVL